MRFESRARERAVLFAYASDMEGSLPTDMICELQKEDSLEVKKFADKLFEGMSREKNVIDALIGSHLKNWSIDRLSPIDRSILRIAVYELLYYDETPAKVVFDEYVELAKRYGDKDSGGFINAILDAIYKDKK